jgi:hypothetical protein
MTMTLIVDVVEALRAALTGHDFSRQFAAQRGYQVSHELMELADLKVTIIPRGLEHDLANRTAGDRQVQVDVAIQQKLPEDPAAEIAFCDELTGLVEQIADFVGSQRAFGPGLWVGTANEPIYSPDHLRDKRVFTSVLTFTFRIIL